MSLKKIQQITVKALIAKSNKVLFVKDHKGKWELPGGRIEFGENPEETLRREIKEELGFGDLKIGKVVHIWSFVSQVEDSEHQFIVIVYECSSESPVIKHNDEYEEYKWVDQDGVNQLNMRGGYRLTVDKYFHEIF